MSTKHTATPWSAHGIYIAGDGTMVAKASYGEDMLPDFEVAKANAALIVQCVNSHDALVAVLQEVIESDFEMSERGSIRLLQACRAALSTATRSTHE